MKTSHHTRPIRFHPKHTHTHTPRSERVHVYSCLGYCFFHGLLSIETWTTRFIAFICKQLIDSESNICYSNLLLVETIRFRAKCAIVQHATIRKLSRPLLCLQQEKGPAFDCSQLHAISSRRDHCIACYSSRIHNSFLFCLLKLNKQCGRSMPRTGILCKVSGENLFFRLTISGRFETIL